MTADYYHWTTFLVLILVVLILDLRRFYRSPHVITMREAAIGSIGWILLALLFNLWIYFRFGFDPALEFFTGYLVEKSLSVDNLFVFLLLFSHFNVPESSKHQVLFYGVLGAVVMRALLIWGGIVLVEKFTWMFLLFGLFLIFTGAGLLKKKEANLNPEDNFLFRLMQKFIPFSSEYHGDSFIVKQGGKWIGTPLLAVLIMIEMTDLVFALDSVPAILGITTNSFIVFTSNIFAILGLRSLFFVLEKIMKSFYLLHYALAFILIFIGAKMMLLQWIHIPTFVTLTIIAVSITVSILASLKWPESGQKSSFD